MKKSDVKKWVKALRSGDYQQGKESLCREEVSGDYKYCCLGVACDILTEDDWVEYPILTEDDWVEYPSKTLWTIGKYEEFDIPDSIDKHGWGSTETTSFPSFETLKKMGLNADYAQELAECNDRGWSFKRIANKIEKDLL